MAARAAPRFATSRPEPVPARFLWLAWNKALLSPIAGFEVTIPQTTSLSSVAAEVPNRDLAHYAKQLRRITDSAFQEGEHAE